MAGDGAATDLFGCSVSISGDVAIVGASNKNDKGPNSGAAYIFGQDEGGVDNWGEVKKLTAAYFSGIVLAFLSPSRETLQLSGQE